MATRYRITNPIIRIVLGKIMYTLLLIIYLPLFLFGYFAVKKKLFQLKIQRFFGINVVKESKLMLVSRRSRVRDVGVVTTDDEIDFLENRSLAYLIRMAFWTPDQLIKTIFGDSNIELISDEQLAYIILHTVFAHSVGWDDKRQMYRLHMDGFEDLFLFHGFYWDARHVLVSPDGKKLVIQMQDGKEYHSDCPPEERATFDLAKLHVQVCLSYFAPGLSHNHVHFVFPSAVTHCAQKLLDHDGVLYNLLSPHFRFTERINYQALRVGKATNNKRGMDRFFFFWQPFPVTKEQFMEGVAAKCKRHYVDKGREDCSQETILNGHSTTNGGYDVIPENNNMKSPARRHTLFPPNFVTDPKIYKIPYMNFLKQYYHVFEKYVASLEQYVDMKEWERFREGVGEFVPRFEEVGFVEGIATFLHQVAVIHHCDHRSYTKLFAYEYGCMSIRCPFEPFEEENAWEEINIDLNLDVEEIKKNPTKLIRCRDVLRTRCFLDLFVDFIPNPSCNVQLVDTTYKFDESGTKMAAENFIAHLKSLDGDLKTQASTIPIERGNSSEKRSVGMQLVELDNIVRTICY